MTRIAVVEDDESIQKLITYALTANGYEARGFSRCTTGAVVVLIPDIASTNGWPPLVG